MPVVRHCWAPTYPRAISQIWMRANITDLGEVSTVRQALRNDSVTQVTQASGDLAAGHDVEALSGAFGVHLRILP